MLPHKQIESALQAAVRAVLPDADVSTVLVRPCDPKFGDYQSNALMSLAKTRKMNPRQLATDVVAKLDVFEISDICEKVEIAGAGFLNFRLKPALLKQTLEAAARGEHLFFDQAASPKTVVIDFSSPNVAKPMHVGHIRSTGIGDALQRTLRLLGHRVISDNHIGDWGTQFGLLLLGWKNFYERRNAAKKPIEELVRIYKLANFACELPPNAPTVILQVLEVVKNPESELHEAWNKIRKLDKDGFEQFSAGGFLESDFALGGMPALKATILVLHKSGYLSKESPELIHQQSVDWVIKAISLAMNPPTGFIKLMDVARHELVKLQSGNSENVEIWKEMIHLSQRQFDWIYKRLGVQFDFALGESFYNPWLGEVVNDLQQRGIARESEGAVGVFSDGSLPPKEDPFLVNRDGEWVADPALVRKSDGGFNYMTTDLATIDYRLKTWSPDEIVYVVDDRQAGHFKKLFLTFGRWKSVEAKNTKLVHVGFGKIMGDDGKPFKTRSGDTVKLGDLLDEAEERAYKIVSEKSAELPEAQRKEIARVIGLGAVKYADLLPNRQSDYIFSWDKMLALQGNTAPYLVYAYARIKSIFRKSESSSSSCSSSSSNSRSDDEDENEHEDDKNIILSAPEELTLAKHLLNFGLTLEAVAEELRPNYLCNYLFELAGKFTSFYENCPVLKADDTATRDSRLALCALTARVLKQGLETLGIETVEQM